MESDGEGSRVDHLSRTVKILREPVNCFARIIFIVCTTLVLRISAANLGTNAFGIEKRIPFTTSRLIGSPDPPLPYRAKRAFPKLDFKHPLYIAHLPGSERMLVVEQSERILAFTNDPGIAATNIFCFIPDHEIYSVSFHSGYASNRFAYVFANGPQSSQHKTNKIFRYVVDRASLNCDDSSRQLIIDWESNGHNGGDLAFGLDGMLYISSGDGTSDSDKNVTGQDITDLNSGILRIDVEHPAADLAYSVPKDNPFLNIPNARGELWAYGFRNPWRIHFDSTSNLWVGDIGQDLWEMIIIARRGANYGWSVTEGGHPFQLNRKRGPTPLSAPTIEHPHSEARSITGGIVYRGNKLPKLRGAYIYGDYGTGRIWDARYRNGRIDWNELIADTPHQMLGFGEDAHGEMFYADYAGAIYELEPSLPSTTTNQFPHKLSETGLFTSLMNLKPQPGVISYSVNAPYWADGAHMERFIALPGESHIEYDDREPWKFPEGAVLVQNLALEMERGNPKSRKWIETRVLLCEQNEWAAYTYQWNDEQTDAVLLPSSGDEREFTIKGARSPRGVREQTWHYPSRTECLTCHSRQAGFALGFTTSQLNRDHHYNGVVANQFSTLLHIGVLQTNLYSEQAQRRSERRGKKEFRVEEFPRLTNPYDTTAPLTNRVRAYLAANCSHCHTEAGGGNSAMELTPKTKLADMRIIDVKPQHDTFELPDARIIAPGHPERSVMFWRLTHRGFGQMPPLAIATVDEEAVRLFEAWIRSLKPD
jgi:uncharacterized repeat protein (TIGR03806 family)